MANTYKALQTVTVGAGGVASVSFTNIPQTYTDLVIKTSYRSTRNAAGDTLRIVFSNGTTYNQIVAYGNGSTVANFTGSSSSGIEGLWGSDDSNTANVFGNSEMYIPNYALSNVKRVSEASATENNAVTAFVAWSAGVSNSTSPITSITLTSNTSSTIKQYSTFTLYGVFNADVSSAPATPTIGTATAGAGSASITFTGVANAASYTMTSTPSSITATGTTSPITVSGLTNEVAYTFKVKANNPIGSSAESAASNSVTPSAAAFESISTSTVSGSSVAYVEFTSVPSTYKNLQIRFMAKTVNGGVSSSAVRIEYNSDTTTGNYYSAYWLSNSITFSTAQTGGPNYGTWIPNSGAVASSGFGYGVIDIFDYTNTNKFTQSMSNSGYADSNYRQVHQSTQAWRNTTTPTTIRLTPYDGNIAVGSYFALYGIEG